VAKAWYRGEKAKVPEDKPLRIRLLGPPEASLWGRGLRFGTKKVLALLCYLAAEEKKYPRGELAELLWPRSDRQSADGPAQHPEQAQDGARGGRR
jgi:hypothetical protein